MSIRAYLSGNSVHDRAIKAFAQGCKAKLIEGWKYEPADIAVVFGVRKNAVPQSWQRGKILDKQRRDGGRCLILETGYVNRGDGEKHHYAAGWNSFNGRADFRNAGMASDRWEKLGIQLRPWRDSGPRFVVCAQIPWDASVQHHDHIGWCQMVCARLGKLPGASVVFRPHPMASGVNYGVRGVEISSGPLVTDEPSIVVTFNSNSAVEAVIGGVPAVAMDTGSMAWPVTAHALEDALSPVRCDREQWTSDLAYAQWNLEEMRSGEAWAHLSR